MTQISIDFSDVESFEALEPGKYPIVVESVEMRASTKSENPYLNWELRITNESAKNRRLFLMTSLSPKALWRLKGIFENLGIYEEQMELQVDEESGILISPAIVGVPAIAVVAQEVYQGRVQNRVEDLLPPEGRAPSVVIGGKASETAPAKATTKPKLVLK